MDKRIIIKNYETYQLINLAIEIVDNIRYLQDCDPGFIQTNKNLEKAYNLSVKWNELFCDLVVSNKLKEITDNE